MEISTCCFKDFHSNSPHPQSSETMITKRFMISKRFMITKVHDY